MAQCKEGCQRVVNRSFQMSKHINRKRIPNDSAKLQNQDSSPRVHQRDKIDYELHVKQRYELTDKQKALIELILDRKTRVVFLSGPAGTSKTYVSILAGLMLLNQHSVSDILFIRTVIESASRSLGFLPGEFDSKFEPYLRPLVDKLEELLPQEQIDQLLKEKRAEGRPVNFLRGASFNARYIVTDEAQNLDKKELTTVITRLGQFSKLIIAGDPAQSDIGERSGFQSFYDLFNDEESRENGIHCLSFTKEDIVRSGILKYIVGKLEAKAASEPMFEAKP